ncbi:hypothetical protein MNBD_GAMMA08-201 [hydrothermal vent metagenome]|uniref:Uncharacterized protein n=1 Tax=hydrothermal vent metagenome TaxID=652676 RepID=A0A3B0XPY3_9ZZZZ
MKTINLASAILFLIFPLSAYADNEKIYRFKISKDINVVLHEKNIKSNTTAKNLPNGNLIFGATRTPKTYVNKITFYVNNKSYNLENMYMYNAWGNRPLEVPNVIKYFDAHCYDNSNCTIRGIFSDAAGSFVAEWKIINGESFRTIITDSSDVLGVFKNNISPPVFE